MRRLAEVARRGVRRANAHRGEASVVGGFMIVVTVIAAGSGAARWLGSVTGEGGVLTAVVLAFATLWLPIAVIDFRRCTRETALRAKVEQDLEHHTTAARAEARAHAIVSRATEEILANGGPTIVYQPIVAMASGRVVGFEALSRFGDARPPDVWFADAARVGLDRELELSAIENALRHFDLLPSTSYISVNVSPTTLVDPRLRVVIARYEPCRTVVELTEHVSCDDYETVGRVIADLRDQGVRVAVDDTGSGYASLRHIVDLRPDIIKIDRSLVRGVDLDPARRSLMVALVAFARDVDATLIAEGVECADEARVLRTWGVQFGQGWLYGKPGPAPACARHELVLSVPTTRVG